MMRHLQIQPRIRFDIFTQPNTSVTILVPNHYYVINATQGNLEQTLGPLWAHSELLRANP